MDKLQHFLLEQGKGFAFLGRQQRISTKTQDFYVDLVFYNYLLKCFVLIDLKSGHLSHQDIGQMDMHVRLYDDLRPSENDNPTVGILLCGSKQRPVSCALLSFARKRATFRQQIPLGAAQRGGASLRAGARRARFGGGC